MHDLSAFQRDLLYTIAAHDRPKGLTIKADLETYYGSEVNHGRLYPNLDDLVGDGLIVKGSKDKRTNYYELTDRGRALLEDRRRWENDRMADADIVTA